MAGDIRTYRLLDVEDLEKNAAIIAEVLFRLPERAVGTLFTISPGGGWLSFVDRSKLGTDREKRLPKNELEAREAALRFFAERRAAMVESRRYRESQLPSLIPLDDMLTDGEFGAVPHRLRPQVDHWLCRFGIVVRCSDDDEEEKAEVVGAGIDLRIGEDGEVIAADWRWRPSVETRSRPRRERPHDTHRIVYRYNDEAARQTFLAPYYEIVHGHDTMLAPASDRSLICVIIPRNGKLLAAVDGGTGDYSFTWGRISAASFPPAIELLGATTRSVDADEGRSTVVSEADFGDGAADVLLNIRDNGSGAVLQLRRAIYPTLFGSDLLG